MNFVLIPIVAFAICFILHKIALKDFVKMNLLDFPERYGLERKKLPYPTGILELDTRAPEANVTEPCTKEVRVDPSEVDVKHREGPLRFATVPVGIHGIRPIRDCP